MRENTDFWSGKRVAILPCTALGDVTIYLRLAWLFHIAGAQVRFISSTLTSAVGYFPWLQVESSESVDLPTLAGENDLVVSYINWLMRDAESVAETLQASKLRSSRQRNCLVSLPWTAGLSMWRAGYFSRPAGHCVCVLVLD